VILEVDGVRVWNDGSTLALVRQTDSQTDGQARARSATNSGSLRRCR
jgi:hypothetical protein